MGGKREGWQAPPPNPEDNRRTAGGSAAAGQGVSLHSYRYHMAEWCATVGMPMRFAQIMLGHSSKTVANAYARKCKKAAPTPEVYIKAPVADMIDGTRLVA